MSNKEAIKIFKEAEGIQEQIPHLIDAYRVAIEALEKQINNGWIPCDERLPDNEEDVLIWYEYFRYGEYQCPYQTIGIGSMYCGEWSRLVNGTTGWKDLKIIAWQPLPEPYQMKD